MSTFLDKLRQEQEQLFTSAQAVIDTAAKEERELTDEERGANDTKFARLKTIETTIADQTKFAGIQLAKGNADTGRETPGTTEFNASEGRQTVDPDADPLVLSEPDKRRYAREVNTYANTGEIGKMARKFATITTTSNSGILLPRSVLPPITPDSANVFREAMDFYGVKPVETTTAAALSIPVLDATAGGVVAENATVLTESAALTESISLVPKTFESGSAWFSNLALAANDFDVLSNVLPSLTYNKELGLESAAVAAMIADAGITQNVSTGSTTLLGTTSTAAYTNLVALNRKLPKRYDRQKVIVLGRDAFSAMESLVGSDGHPVLVMDPQNSAVLKFNGTPVLRSDYFEAFGVTKCIGVIVSLLGFRLRDVTVQNLARYVNYPGRPNQTGLNLFAYHAYGWAPSAVAKLMTSAS